MISLVSAKWLRLPKEMQDRPQWCIAGPDKAPYLVSSTGLYRASPVTGPWLDFETAISYAEQYGINIGYVLTPTDPYTCIDLDVKDIESVDKDGLPIPPDKWTTPEQLYTYEGLVQACESYTELSASGKGLHIWVKASLAQGRRGGGIEVYSSERFIVCTGTPVSNVKFFNFNNVIIPILRACVQNPIYERQELVDNVVNSFTTVHSTIDLVEVEQVLSDEEIWNKLSNGGNSEKFLGLFKGLWKNYAFESQSEADLALMSMFTFYSKSNEQCRRMFRFSGLGKRDKAVKNDVYLNRTLKEIRARQERESSAARHGESLAKGFLANLAATQLPQQTAPTNIELPTNAAETVADLVGSMQVQKVQVLNEAINEPLPEVPGLEWPPGFVGALAGFIYKSAPRPVKEVAIVAALGLMAGILGKSYLVGQSGLNLYIILVARSAIGKEAMHSGIGHILNSGDQAGGAATTFVNFTDFASGPALVKACEEKHSFVNVAGEWGRKLKRLSLEDGREGPMQQLRTVMTNLYQKSGPSAVVGGISYSNKDQNVESVTGIAYSMIGETTPGTFYEALTSSMMEDGFLSRFNIVEYTGERPPPNEHPITTLSPALGNALFNISTNSARMNQYRQTIGIKIEGESARIFDEFNKKCDKNINIAGEDESRRQMWNRAHLKAMRIAGVLAASDNHIVPSIEVHHANWAIDLVMKDIKQMNAKLNSGDIGFDDEARFAKFSAVLKDYLVNKQVTNKSYDIDPRMQKDGIVPRKYLQARTASLRSFTVHRLGATAALNDCIRTAIDSGYIIEADKSKAIDAYNFHGRCFRVLDLPK